MGVEQRCIIDLTKEKPKTLTDFIKDIKSVLSQWKKTDKFDIILK